jgi:uncharacterized membrane protein
MIISKRILILGIFVTGNQNIYVRKRVVRKVNESERVVAHY